VQRALFARLLLQDSKLVLLDEPFNAIDAGTTADLIDVVKRWHGEGRTVLAVLHDIDAVRAHWSATYLWSTSRLMWELFFEPFADFGFMRRALLGCIAVSVGATPLGVFLMLRRMSLTGDAMAHAILPGAAVGYLVAGLSLGAMTIGGLVAGMTVALLSGYITRVTELREDTSLAAFYLISLALGVLIISTRGSNVDLMHVLFGSVLALDNAALILLCTIATLTVFLLALFFDSQFLRSVSGLSATTYFIFLTLVVMNLVGGFHALGTLMAVGIMILPAAVAKFWAQSITGLILLSATIALLASYSGLLLSYHFSLPSGPAIILVAGSVYVVSLVFGLQGGIVQKTRTARTIAL